MEVQHIVCVHKGCLGDCCFSVMTGVMFGLLSTLYILSFIDEIINKKIKYTLTLRQLMSYIYGAPILDVSRSHTTQHSR